MNVQIVEAGNDKGAARVEDIASEVRRCFFEDPDDALTLNDNGAARDGLGRDRRSARPLSGRQYLCDVAAII